MNFMVLLSVGETDDDSDIFASLLVSGLFNQTSLICFPTGTPACVPAQQPCHKGFGVGFSFFSHRTGFTAESLLSEWDRVIFHLILLLV